MIALQLLPLALLVTFLMLAFAYLMREFQHSRHKRENEEWLLRLARQLEEGVLLAGAMSDCRNGIDTRIAVMRALVTEHNEQLATWKVCEQTLQDLNEDLHAWGERYPAWVFQQTGSGGDG